MAEPTPSRAPGGDRDSVPKGAFFPLRSRFDWGDGLGAGRGHQGQDLLTKCRKPVLAVQPGRVQVRKRHSAAGNYVVIDGRGKRKDAVYMHLLRKARVRKGERVEAGEQIGLVGRTGRASACHLHFELWSGDGWYEGGRPIDPEPSLRKWRRDHGGYVLVARRDAAGDADLHQRDPRLPRY